MQKMIIIIQYKYLLKNHIIVNKLLALDKNTGNHITLCKQMIIFK